MNRRTLLGGAAASAALLCGSRIDVRRSLAQAPAYTAETIYEFTVFSEGSYSPLSDGNIYGVTPDGVITGRDWLDGKLVPVTWDLNGNRTVLDMGDIPFATTRNLVPGAAGYLVGNVAESVDPGALNIGVLWTGGVPSLIEPNNLAGAVANTVNGEGVVAGSMNDMASRWVDGQVTQLPVPEGSDWSTIRALAENGDAYGYAYSADGGVTSLFKWTMEGDVEAIPIPEEVAASGVSEVQSVGFPGVFADTGFVLSLDWSDPNGSSSGSWIYEGGVTQRVESSAANTLGRVSHALNTSNMIGFTNPGEGNPLGFIGPTQWIDGVPYSLEALTTLPPGLPLSSGRGITADGVIVATTFSFGSESPPAHILVLRPMS